MNTALPRTSLPRKSEGMPRPTHAVYRANEISDDERVSLRVSPAPLTVMSQERGNSCGLSGYSFSWPARPAWRSLFATHGGVSSIDEVPTMRPQYWFPAARYLRE